MKQTPFNHIMNSAEVDDSQLEELHAILEAYPYFQAARAVYLKGLYQTNSFLYDAALNVTAAYTTDRSVLFDYITADVFEQETIAERIKKHRNHDGEEAEENELDESLMNAEEAALILDPQLFKPSDKNAPSPMLSKSFSDEDDLEAEKEPISSKSSDAYDSQETHSFADWLKLAGRKSEKEKNDVSKPKVVPENEQKLSREHQMIDQFIKNNPKIKPTKKLENHVKIKDYEPDKGLMTETLAQIYARQKNFDKAIQAYKILILKNPEKSGLFANRIREIEISKENKSQ
ncbi:MAG TPA: hypothetical protein VK106_03250 [Balneolaceae bacterium]|nr:hypothetical protein [Balneolaceae bacterium]